jgi:CRP-like cAMP-binding protein
LSAGRQFTAYDVLVKRRTPADYLELLRAGRWFGAIPDDLQVLMLARAHLRTFAKGRSLLAPGDRVEGLYGVVDGSAVLRNVAGDDRPAIVRMAFDPPSWFGELALTGSYEPMEIEIIASVETRTVFLAHDDFQALARAHPALWRHVADLAIWHVRLALTALFEVEQHTSLARVAHRLALMAEGYGDYTGNRRIIALGQEALAMTLGLSRQTLSSLLKQLEHARLIAIGYRKIEVLDPGGLRRVR